MSKCLLREAGFRALRARNGSTGELQSGDSPLRMSRRTQVQAPRCIQLRAVNLITAAQTIQDIRGPAREKRTQIILVGPKPSNPLCPQTILSAMRQGAQ